MIAAPDSFVPLAAPAPQGKTGDFRVLVAESPEKARPLLELNPASAAPAANRPAHKTCEPRVTLQRDGDCVIGIEVQCSCGETIQLKCSYDAAPPSSKPA